MAQGLYFLDDGLFAQAAREFEAAALTSTGLRDPEIHTLLARTYFRLGDVASSVAAMKTAEALSRGELDPGLAELREFLLTRFGKVLILGAGAEAQRPEPAAAILDPELKRIFEQNRERMSVPSSSGSTSLFLPVGNYRVGGHIVEVKAGTTNRMDLRPTVGRATAGVYGERRTDPNSSTPARRPPLDSALLVRFGGHAFYQQTSGSAGARVLLGWAPSLFRGRVGLLVGGTLAMQRLERILATDPAPGGFLPSLLVAAGPVFQLATSLAITPRLGWSIGYGHPLESGLPAGYRGPVHYLVHGPEFELTVRFRTATGTNGARSPRIEPVVGARVMFQESTAVGEIMAADQKPHLTFGGGIEFGLRVGS